MPQWPQTSLSSPRFVFPASALSVPGARGLRTGPALPKWGYLLFKAGELPWDWLIDPNGNDSCPGLLTVTFNPLEKSIPPILAYLLFVKHSWLQVSVKIILAARHFYVQGQINSLQAAVGSFLKKHISPLILQEKNTLNLWSGMQQVLPSLLTPAPFYCESISLPVTSFKTKQNPGVQ